MTIIETELARRPSTVDHPQALDDKTSDAAARTVANAAELAEYLRRQDRHMSHVDEPARVARFVDAVVLTKSEVFRACQSLADADRLLQRSGALGEARALGDLFELLEQRMAVTR